MYVLLRFQLRKIGNERFLSQNYIAPLINAQEDFASESIATLTLDGGVDPGYFQKRTQLVLIPDDE
jgi:hypothetical protein